MNQLNALSNRVEYYEFDVYLYYLITFALPVAAARLRHGAVA
jgi:hypothetical protein